MSLKQKEVDVDLAGGIFPTDTGRMYRVEDVDAAVKELKDMLCMKFDKYHNRACNNCDHCWAFDDVFGRRENG